VITCVLNSATQLSRLFSLLSESPIYFDSQGNEHHPGAPIAEDMLGDLTLAPPTSPEPLMLEESQSDTPSDVNKLQPSTLEQVLVTGDLMPEEGIHLTSEKINSLETQIAELSSLHDKLSELDFTLTPGEPVLPSTTEEAIDRLLSSVAAVIPGGIYIGDMVEDAVQSAEIADQLANQISQLETELSTEQTNLDILEEKAGQAVEQEPPQTTQPEDSQAIEQQERLHYLYYGSFSNPSTHIEPPPSESESTDLPPKATSEMQPGIPLTDEQAEQLGVPWYQPLVPPPPMRELWDQVWAGELTPEEASQQAAEMGFQKAPDTWDIPPEAGEQWDKLESGEMSREEWTKLQEQRPEVELSPEEVAAEEQMADSPPTGETVTGAQIEEAVAGTPSDEMDISEELIKETSVAEESVIEVPETETPAVTSTESADVEEPPAAIEETAPVEGITANEFVVSKETTTSEEQIAEADIEEEPTEMPAKEKSPEEMAAEDAALKEAVAETPEAETQVETPPSEDSQAEDTISEPPASDEPEEETPSAETHAVEPSTLEDVEEASPPTEDEISVDTVKEEQPTEDNAEIESPPPENTSTGNSEGG